MNSRERGILILEHKEADRIPFDLGGTVLTSIHVNAYQKLRQKLELPEVDVNVMDIFQQIATVDDDMRARLGSDVRNVAPRSSATYKIEINTTDMPGYDFFHDEWGIGWRKPKDGGFFYDMFDHPLFDATRIDDIKNFPWPDPSDPNRFTGLQERARSVAEDLGELVILGGLSAGVVEVTAWMRGFAKFYPDFVLNRKWLGYLMDKIVELKMAYWDIALPMVGEYADVVQEADDVAGQFDLLMSPEDYRTLIKPRHKKLFDFIKTRSNAKIFFHSCGAIREIIPDLIEIGVDIINPVQVNAAGMESKGLKRDFGDALTFWGGLVDTQGVFLSGTPQQVRDEARRRIDDFGPNGGFVAATVHNIQANVPPENIIAMWEALREFGVYAHDNAPGRRPETYWEGYPQVINIPSVTSQSPDIMPARALTKEEVEAILAKEAARPQVLTDLSEAVISGNRTTAREALEKTLEENIEPQIIIDDIIIPAMSEVGNRFENGEYFLPEMMASALATQACMNVLRPLLAETGAEPVAKVAIGTVKGDLHDIGKNLVAMMWEGGGFDVVDLGPDVPAERFIAEIKKGEVELVGMSALLTTTMPMMRTIIDELETAGVRDMVKVMVGGAGVTQEFADDIGADGFAQNASAAVREAKNLLGIS